jgi:hypothetical protein
VRDCTGDCLEWLERTDAPWSDFGEALLRLQHSKRSRPLIGRWLTLAAMKRLTPRLRDQRRGLMTAGVNMLGWPVSELERRLGGLYDLTLTIFAETAQRGVTPLAVADGLVAERLRVVEAPA